MMEIGRLIAVRPPEYFPGLAYTALMQATHTFVMADTFQYSRQSFQNRTRIRNSQSWQWVSVPLKGGQHGLPQHAIRVRQESGWKKRHWKAFLFNYSSTPFFEYFAPELQALFKTEWSTLSRLTCQTVKLTHKWLKLDCTVLCASELPGRPATMDDVLECLPAGNLIGACGIPEPAARLEHTFEHPRYRQAFEGFQTRMSVLDLLFNYGPDSARIIRSGSSIVSI